MQLTNGDAHSQLYQFFNELPKKIHPRDYLWDYKNGKPVPFLVIDDFLPQDLFHQVSQQTALIPQDYWTRFTRNGSCGGAGGGGKGKSASPGGNSPDLLGVEVIIT